MSMSPAIAALAGLVLLGQLLTPLELAGIVLVIAAGVGAVRAGVSESSRREGEPDEAPLAASDAMIADPTGPLAILNGPLGGLERPTPIRDAISGIAVRT